MAEPTDVQDCATRAAIDSQRETCCRYFTLTQMIKTLPD